MSAQLSHPNTETLTHTHTHTHTHSLPYPLRPLMLFSALTCKACPLLSLACFCCCFILNGFLWKLLPHHLVALSLEWGA